MWHQQPSYYLMLIQPLPTEPVHLMGILGDGAEEEEGIGAGTDEIVIKIYINQGLNEANITHCEKLQPMNDDKCSTSPNSMR